MQRNKQTKKTPTKTLAEFKYGLCPVHHRLHRTVRLQGLLSQITWLVSWLQESSSQGFKENIYKFLIRRHWKDEDVRETVTVKENLVSLHSVKVLEKLKRCNKVGVGLQFKLTSLTKQPCVWCGSRRQRDLPEDDFSLRDSAAFQHMKTGEYKGQE